MSRRRLIEEALDAIEDGRLSVEQVLRRSFGGAEAYEAWLTRALSRARQAEPRRVSTKEHPGFAPEVAGAALRAARRAFGRWKGVVGVAWGLLEKRGRTSGQQGLIVIVEEKLSAETLRKPRVLPRTFDVAVGSRRLSVPVDVQRLARGVKEQQAGAGNRALVRVSQAAGTLSALVEHDGSFVGIVSGHLARREGEVVVAELANGDTTTLGTVAQTREDLDIDGARVDGVSPDDAPFLTSAFADIRDLDSTAVNERLTVRRAQGDGEAYAYISEIETHASFKDDRGRKSPMRGLIKLDKKVTRGGDSGAPVLDHKDRLVGFVIGSANGHTYAIPARRVIDAMF